MPRARIDPAILRQIAADIIANTAPETGFLPSEWPDLITSLVRQWLTYDHNAALFADERRQFNYIFKRTPLGGYGVDVERKESQWIHFIREWKINPDDVPDMLFQLNRGQAAEVVDSEGRMLRVFVDPKRRTKGVEPEVKETRVLEKDKRYEKIASSQVERQIGNAVAPDMKDDLVRSIVEQWRRYDGHACVFMDERLRLTLDLSDHEDGRSDLRATKAVYNAGSMLVSYGVQPWDVPDVLARINLGEEVEFKDRQGRTCLLSYDPKAGRFGVRTADGAPLAATAVSTLVAAAPRVAGSPPLFCPKCMAVLSPWAADQLQQICPICGQPVAHG